MNMVSQEKWKLRSESPAVIEAGSRSRCRNFMKPGAVAETDSFVSATLLATIVG
jgi:hypothetical protein